MHFKSINMGGYIVNIQKPIAYQEGTNKTVIFE